MGIVGSVWKLYRDRDLAGINGMVVLFRHIDNQWLWQESQLWGIQHEYDSLRYWSWRTTTVKAVQVAEAFGEMDAVYKDDLQIWGNHMIAPVMQNYPKEHVMMLRSLDISKQDKNSKFAYWV